SIHLLIKNKKATSISTLLLPFSTHSLTLSSFSTYSHSLHSLLTLSPFTLYSLSLSSLATHSLSLHSLLTLSLHSLLPFLSSSSQCSTQHSWTTLFLAPCTGPIVGAPFLLCRLLTSLYYPFSSSLLHFDLFLQV